jgi:hypothetical protein
MKIGVFWGNALLTFAGASVGGVLLPVKPVRKAKITAAVGFAGLLAYFCTMAAGISFGLMG